MAAGQFDAMELQLELCCEAQEHWEMHAAGALFGVDGRWGDTR